MSLRNKKTINYNLKGLYKTTCYKTKSDLPHFFFSHWLLHECFFSFVINALVNLRNWYDFIDKNGENLKILIEIFGQKLIVSNVISAFLNHLKPKIFLLANHGGWHRAPSLFKISGSAPEIFQFLNNSNHQKFFNF